MNKIDYNKDNIYHYAEYGSNAYKSNHNPQQLPKTKINKILKLGIQRVQACTR